MTGTSDTGIDPGTIEDLLNRAGIRGGFEIRLIPGGRNNRVYELTTHEGSWLLKEYFRHPSDPRDRLGQECSFIDYAWKAGVRRLPFLYSYNAEKNLSLLEFIQGKKIKAGQIDTEHIQQAVSFFHEINTEKMTESALRLSSASEACFSLSSHLSATQTRVERLKQMERILDIDREGVDFVESELIPSWDEILYQIESKTTVSDRNNPLKRTEQCLSPSDFGYHNALQEKSGLIRFIDFEYAGWDDPAKLICDFSNQPDMILDDRLSHLFTEAIINQSDSPERLFSRVKIVLPVYQLKWSCIILNDFLPFGRQRRSFTDQTFDEEERKSHQLVKSRKMLERARQSAAQIN